MRILVYPHRLEIGGSQTNAIDVATALRDRGHELVFFASPGPGEALVEERGFRLIRAPHRRAVPSPALVRALSRAVRAEAPDLVHAWDWPQYFDAAFGAAVRHGVPVVGSNMSMVVTRSAPLVLPLTYGTPQLADEARAIGRAPVLLLEPPVNTDRDNPAVVDGEQFRRQHGLAPDDVVLVVVSRLVGWMKLEGILRTMAVVDRAAERAPVRFVVVGGGTAEAEIAVEAEKVNTRHGRPVVLMTGPLGDPRPAYAAADVVIGMGGSILRGMAFGKPAVVLGEEGFSLAFTRATADRFLEQGFYGRGEVATLADELGPLLSDPQLRADLGPWSRDLVVRRFSHHAAAELFEPFLEQARTAPVRRAAVALDGARAVLRRGAARLLRR